MARMGMDADAVESAGRALKERAGQIDAIVSNLDRSVKGLLNIWDGQDAQTFVHTWWPEHRALLVNARGHVDGLGQSALNNASEQRGVSDVKGSGGNNTQPNSGPGATVPPSTGGSGQGTSAADFAEWRSTHPDGNSAAVEYDKGYGIQCVGLIKQYVADLYGSGAVVAANGNEVWANYGATGNFDQIDRSATPQAGDIIAIDAWPAHSGSPANPYGHTAIVDHVDANGTVWMVQQSGSEQSRGIFVTQLSDFYKPYVQGYLRPHS